MPFSVRKSNNGCEAPPLPVTPLVKKCQCAPSIAPELVETAKANGLNVYAYLKHLLINMPDTLWRKDPGVLDELMPWSEKVQEACK